MTQHRAGASDVRAQSGIVSCLIGPHQFALRTDDVRLVTRAEEMKAEQGHGARVGVLTHGGASAPVYCLATLLGLPPARGTSGRHVVVTSGANGRYGLLVDRIVRSARNEHFHLLPLPALVGPRARRWFEGLVQAGELSCLALAPATLQPGAAESVATARTNSTPAPCRTPDSSATEMAVIFSSAALPACGEHRYALGARQIAAVVQTMTAVSLPGAPRFVTAVAAWRQKAVPVVDFAGGSTPASGGRWLVLGTRNGALIALPVDADLVVHRVTGAETLVAPGSTEFVKGVFVAGEERVALLDIDALLASGEHAVAAVCAV